MLDALHGTRLHRIGFDAVLDDPAQALARLATHYGVVPPPDLEARIAASGLLTRDTKIAGRAFTPVARTTQLDASRALNADAIRDGLTWTALALRNTAPGDEVIAARLRPA